jgi:hypothetical protein
MWIPTRIGFDQAEAINPAEVIVQQHEPGKHRSDLVGWGDQGELVERFTHLKPTIATQNEQEPKAHAQNCRNWTVWFCKPDDLILSRLMTVRGTAGLWWGAPPPAKWRLDGGEAWTTIPLEVVVMNSRSNRRKMKIIEKLGQKYENYKFDWLCWH